MNSLGPVLWYWPKETLEEFYQQAATSSADVIILVKRYAASVGQPKLATGWRWQNRSPGVVSGLCLHAGAGAGII